MIKIGVVGLGFVGGSMVTSFQLKGYKLDQDLYVYDKYKDGGTGSLESVLQSEVMFLALPTMYDETLKQYNKEALLETCTKLVQYGYLGAVVIKSTVEPETTHNLAHQFKINLVHNPEFLTARTAFEDFHNQSHIVLGRAQHCSQPAYDTVIQLYTQLYPQADISLCSSTESECMKIYVNCFYSVKIQFFTELQQLCQNTDTDFNKVKGLMLKNGWISPHHTNIPGPDGQLSYGGLCFPKDTNALLKFMQNKRSPHMVLEATIQERNRMRDDNDNIITDK